VNMHHMRQFHISIASRLTFLFAAALVAPTCLTPAFAADPPSPGRETRDLFSDTWVARDALGRNLPDYSVVGPVKNDHRRVVGNPFFPALRACHRLFQRPSPQKQIPSSSSSVV